MSEEQLFQRNMVLAKSQIACATIEALGMFSENLQRLRLEQSMAYNDEAFNQLIDKYGIHWNGVIDLMSV